MAASSSIEWDKKKIFFLNYARRERCSPFTSSAYASHPFRHTIFVSIQLSGLYIRGQTTKLLERSSSLWKGISWKGQQAKGNKETWQKIKYRETGTADRREQKKKGCHFRWILCESITRPKWTPDPLKGYVGAPTWKCLTWGAKCPSRERERKECEVTRITLRRHHW